MIRAYSRLFFRLLRLQFHVAEHFREADDRIQWRAQFMTDIGQKTRLGGDRRVPPCGGRGNFFFGLLGGDITQNANDRRREVV